MSGPPASAGTAAAQRTAARRTTERLSARIGFAPRLHFLIDDPAHEVTQRLGIHRPVLRVEHLLPFGTELAAVDLDVREQADVVVRIHGHAVAHAELAVAKANSGLKARDPRLRIKEQQTHFTDVPGGPPFRAAAE